MTQRAVAGEFGKGDFRDQFGLEEMCALPFGARNVERGLVDLQRLHPSRNRSSISFIVKPVPTLPA